MKRYVIKRLSDGKYITDVWTTGVWTDDINCADLYPEIVIELCEGDVAVEVEIKEKLC